jgi:hypothetical protein
MKQRVVSMSLPLLGVILAACADGTIGRLSLALSSQPAGAPLAAASAPWGRGQAPSVIAAGDSTVVVLGNDTLVLRSVEIVLREVELKRAEAVECDNVEGNDDCEEFETGAILVALPLGTTATAAVIGVNAPAGMYDELEFEIHKPDASEDAAFIAAHPDWVGVSIRVSGTYSQGGTRSDFVFTSDLNAKQEVQLAPPLTVIAGSTTNVTLRLDIGSWFLNVGGTALVNPATANSGQPNENVVRDRIQASIDAFRDDDRDGHDDDNEHT